MPNMTLQKTPAREQEPNIRNKNFKEVSQGYDEELALNEASRCLNCKNMPCVSGCPVNVRIPEFIAKIAAHDYEGAYAIIKTTNSLPAICGRVCPQENQCESKCVRGIKGEPVGIGRFEGSTEKLTELYIRGYKEMQQKLDGMMEYLEK